MTRVRAVNLFFPFVCPDTCACRQCFLLTHVRVLSSCRCISPFPVVGHRYHKSWWTLHQRVKYFLGYVHTNAFCLAHVISAPHRDLRFEELWAQNLSKRRKAIINSYLFSKEATVRTHLMKCEHVNPMWTEMDLRFPEICVSQIFCTSQKTVM